MTGSDPSGAVPCRREREEFAATARAGKAYGRVLFRHECEEFAHRLDTYRVTVHQQVASR